RSSKPQSIEWVWESGNVWVLQNKSFTSKSILEAKLNQKSAQDSSAVDVAIDIVKEEKLKSKKIRDSVPQLKNADDHSEDEQIETLNRLGDRIKVLSERANNLSQSKKDLVSKHQVASIRKLGKRTLQTAEAAVEPSKRKFEFLLSGIGASFGEVIGEVLIIEDAT